MALANALSKAVADQRQVVKTWSQSYRRVLTWFASRWRNHQPKRAEKPHSKSSGGNVLDGPATRPKTPLAVENSVGKLAAPPCGAPNASMGKRAWRTPIAHFRARQPQGWRARLFLCAAACRDLDLLRGSIAYRSFVPLP